MLINDEIFHENSHVEFVSYTGEYPHLCSGLLTLRIDGNQYSFGYDTYTMEQGTFQKFWSSGGGVWCGDRPYTEKGEWQIDVEKLPQEFVPYAAEIDQVINDNIEYGCCGGCI